MSGFTQLTLLSKEGESFTVDVEAAKEISKLVLESLEDDDDSSPELPIANVKAVTLKKIVDFMIMYKNAPLKDGELKKQIESPDFQKVVNNEDYFNFFLEYDEATPEKMDLLYDLMFAADFMQIPRLLELASAKLACLGKNKGEDSIMELFTGAVASS